MITTGVRLIAQYFTFKPGDVVRAIRDLGFGISRVIHNMTGEVVSATTDKFGRNIYRVIFDDGTVRDVREGDIELVGEGEDRYLPSEAEAKKVQYLKRFKKYLSPGERPIIPEKEPPPSEIWADPYAPPSINEFKFKELYWPGKPFHERMVELFNQYPREAWVGIISKRWGFPKSMAERLYKEFYEASTKAGESLKVTRIVPYSTPEIPQSTTRKTFYDLLSRYTDDSGNLLYPKEEVVDKIYNSLGQSLTKEQISSLIDRALAGELPISPTRPRVLVKPRPRPKPAPPPAIETPSESEEGVKEPKYKSPKDYYQDAEFLAMTPEERVEFLAEVFNKPRDVMKVYYDITFKGGK